MADTPELIPSLKEVVDSMGMDANKLSVEIVLNRETSRLFVPERQVIPVTDGSKTGSWNVQSLAELFRGDKQPPADMKKYPEEMVPHFYFIERQVVDLCGTIGDRTDQEMEETYAALRRRPDGRRLHVVHDFIWQVAALLLGTRPLSEAEFTAIVGRLEASTRAWALRPVSRFYAEYLRKSVGG